MQSLAEANNWNIRIQLGARFWQLRGGEV